MRLYQIHEAPGKVAGVGRFCRAVWAPGPKAAMAYHEARAPALPWRPSYALTERYDLDDIVRPAYRGTHEEGRPEVLRLLGVGLARETACLACHLFPHGLLDHRLCPECACCLTCCECERSP